MNLSIGVNKQTSVLPEFEDHGSRPLGENLACQSGGFLKRYSTRGPAEKNTRLRFVGCQDIDFSQEIERQRLRGRGIEDGLSSFAAREAQCSRDSFQRSFQLKEGVASVAKT